MCTHCVLVPVETRRENKSAVSGFTVNSESLHMGVRSLASESGALNSSANSLVPRTVAPYILKSSVINIYMYKAFCLILIMNII